MASIRSVKSALEYAKRDLKGSTITTGATFWVDSATGTDQDGFGLSEENPVATIDYAIGLCTSNKGDEIYVLPNHAETISSTTALLCDKGGISIIGLGRGNNAPLLTIGNASGGIVITSADVGIENLKLKAGVSAITRAVHVKGKYAHLKNLELLDGGTSHVLVGVEVGAANNDADGGTIEGCRLVQLDSASVNGIVFMKDQVDFRVLDNFCQGDYAVGGIIGAIAANSAENLTRVLVKGNTLISAATDAGIAINLDGPTNTGTLVENYAAAPDGDWTPFVAIGCSFFENFTTGKLASSGRLYPNVTTDP